MKTLFALSFTAALLGACGDSTPTPPSVPNAPAIFGLIDRLGRPGVNTALTNPFDVAKAPGATTAELGDVTKDRFNGDANVASWGTTWSGNVRAHLAILDGLDRNCGNQFGAELAQPRYSALAGILANDQVVLDTSKTTCAQYLAVEAGVAGDCGGRKLDYDVIDVTYSATAIGALTGVDDGVANDSTFSASFPYLANPN